MDFWNFMLKDSANKEGSLPSYSKLPLLSKREVNLSISSNVEK